MEHSEYQHAITETPQLSAVGMRTFFLDLRGEMYFASKRLMDIIIASIALIALLPLLLVVAILVLVDSPGPAIFRQKRITARRIKTSRGNIWVPVEFTCFKFRSMYKGANTDLHQAFIKAFMNNDQAEMSRLNGEKECSVRKLTNDNRISRVGRIIRKTSIDELPQLVNVLNGDMSIVGPRPAIPYEVEQYQPWHHKRLQVKPGLTGWWQVNGRGSVEFEEGMKQDIWYVDHKSILLDILILVKTPQVLFKGK